MLNLSAYTGKELQNFLSILNQSESAHGFDTRFLREDINDHIRLIALRRKTTQKEEPVKCQYGCGDLTTIINNDGLDIRGCRKCGFSLIV